FPTRRSSELPGAGNAVEVSLTGGPDNIKQQAISKSRISLSRFCRGGQLELQLVGWRNQLLHLCLQAIEVAKQGCWNQGTADVGARLRTGPRFRINQDPREQLQTVGTEFAARSSPIGQGDGAPVQLIIVNPDDRRARRQIRIFRGHQGALGQSQRWSLPVSCDRSPASSARGTTSPL